MLSYRFAERKVRRAPRVLRMAVVSQSSVKFGKKRVLLVGATNFKNFQDVCNEPEVCPFYEYYRIFVSEETVKQ